VYVCVITLTLFGLAFFLLFKTVFQSTHYLLSKVVISSEQDRPKDPVLLAIFVASNIHRKQASASKRSKLKNAQCCRLPRQNCAWSTQHKKIKFRKMPDQHRKFQYSCTTPVVLYRTDSTDQYTFRQAWDVNVYSTAVFNSRSTRPRASRCWFGLMMHRSQECTTSINSLRGGNPHPIHTM
jgi:hypothetical protein